MHAVLLGLAILGSGIALALPPARPGNVKAYTTIAREGANTFTYWSITWEDRSEDEAGFMIRGRYLSGSTPASPYFTFDRVGANTTSTVLALANQFGVVPNVGMQFEVIAFKNNGSSIETSTGTSGVTRFLDSRPATLPFGAPSEFKIEKVSGDDGTYLLEWRDNASTEVWHRLSYVVNGQNWDTAATEFRLNLLGETKVRTTLSLVPGTTYNFRLRAENTATAPNGPFTGYSNTFLVTTEPLTPPSTLTATLVEGDAVRLNWRDNSTNTMGYEMQYRLGGTGDFTVLRDGSNQIIYTGGNDTSYQITLGPGLDVEWRVRGVFQDSSGGLHYSAFSNVATVQTAFPAPTNVEVQATGLAGSIAVRWVNQTPITTQILIVGRPVGSSSAYTTLAAVPVSVTSALVTGLQVDQPYEIGVIASGGGGQSRLQDTVNVTPRHGFSPARYVANLDPALFGRVLLTPLQPAANAAAELRRGVAFSHTLVTTGDSLRSGFSLANAPSWMTPLATGSSVLSGTPTVAGVETAEISASFSTPHTAVATLVMRVQEVPGSPVVQQPVPARTIGVGNPVVVPVGGVFRDPDTPKAVRFNTTLGQFDIALFEQVAPRAVANFLAYVNAGDYNGVAFHRSVPGFVVQGGGFKPATAPDGFTTVQRRPSPLNEPGVANVRGLVASAKVGGDPNSATHDFFLNLADNRSNLDLQNQGFTAFGRIAGTGMTVVDQIAALPNATYSVSVNGQTQQFENWPLNDTTAPSSMDIEKTIRIQSAQAIAPVGVSISDNSAPGVVTASLSGSDLVLVGVSDGTADVTLTGTDLDGNTVNQTVTVTVQTGFQPVAIQTQPAAQTVASGATVSLSVAATGSGVLAYQWRRNGVNVDVASATTATLTLTGVTPASAGLYDVVVSNASNTVVSQAAALQVTEGIMISAQPQSRLVRTGESVVFSVPATGSPAPTVSWTRNGQPVTTTGANLTINSASLADAGVYRARVQNANGHVDSEEALLVVVDATPRTVLVKSGGNARLTVATAQPPGVSLTYQWRDKDNNNVVRGGRFGDPTVPSLTVTGTSVVDAGNYTCRVTAGGGLGSVTSGAFNLVIAAQPIVQALSFADAFVAQSYEYTVPVNTELPRKPLTFSATGLPPGLRIESTTGRIHGVPTQRGNFTVRVQAQNPAGISTSVSGSLRVIALPVNTSGTFVGLLARQNDVNAGLGGRVNLTLTDNGAFTGRVILSRGEQSIRGTVTRQVVTSGQTLTTVVAGSAVVKTRGQPDLTLNFSVDASNATLSGDLVLDSTKKSGLTGWKNVWDAQYRRPQDAGFPGNYHFAMEIPSGRVGQLATPQGVGYARIAVSNAGTTSISGRTIDGQVLTCSAPLGPAGSVAVFQLFYNRTGSLLGPLAIAQRDGDLVGRVSHSEVVTVPGFNFDQMKLAQTPPGRDYAAGFGSPVALAVKGGDYRRPPGSVRNAVAKLTSGGVELGAFAAGLRANNSVLGMALQSDGKLVLVGTFSRYGDLPRNGVVRLLTNGEVDTSFNPGSGANGAVYDVEIQSDGKFIVAGAFTSFSGASRNRVARLNQDGSLDLSFDPGTGPNATVEAVAIQTNGLVVIGGSFGRVGTTNRAGVARLTAAGALDTSFNATGTGANGAVRCLALQSDGRILIGGEFTTYNHANTTTNRSRIARLMTTGVLDPDFNPGLGANGVVRTILAETDGKVMIGGDFSGYHTASRRGVARVLANGTLDASFDVGNGAAGSVFSIARRSDARYVVGGNFATFHTQERNGLVLLAATGGVEAGLVSPAGSVEDNQNNTVTSVILDPAGSNEMFVGGWMWVRRTSDRILWMTPQANDARVTFTQARISEGPDPSQTFDVARSGGALPVGANPQRTTWSFNASSGIISGQFTLENGGATRVAKYYGLLVPVTPSEYRGLGSFALPELPSGTTTLKTSIIHTGRVDIAPVP